MVRLIVGGKGAGKTKRIIAMANEQVDSTNGRVVYIDDDMKHSFEIHHDIRLLNMEEYPIDTPEGFYGFLVGIASTDFDIETIYVDGLIKIVGLTAEAVPDYIEKLELICEKNDVNFIMTLSVKEKDLEDSLVDRVI